MNPTSALHDFGQSLWLDNISRELLRDGVIRHYIQDFAVTGLTSNPSIFDRAIRESSGYDHDLMAPAVDGQSPEAVFFGLALADLTQAADLFRPIYDRTDGVDGWVSL
jgi:transaldolase